MEFFFFWTGDQFGVRPLPTQDRTSRISTQIYMLEWGFELTTSVFEKPKTIHAQDHVTNVTDYVEIAFY
jgi:hypothetical protein